MICGKVRLVEPRTVRCYGIFDREELRVCISLLLLLNTFEYLWMFRIMRN